jgi:hypothetical protein
MQVRSATDADAAGVVRVHVATWQVAYRGQVPDNYLDSLSVEDRETIWRRIIAESDPPSRRTFVALDAEAIIGFVHVCPAGTTTLLLTSTKWPLSTSGPAGGPLAWAAPSWGPPSVRSEPPGSTSLPCGCLTPIVEPGGSTPPVGGAGGAPWLARSERTAAKAAEGREEGSLQHPRHSRECVHDRYSEPRKRRGGHPFPHSIEPRFMTSRPRIRTSRRVAKWPCTGSPW